MKLSRLLAFAAVGIVAGLVLTQTDKGNELRRNIADNAGKWGKKLNRLRRQSEDGLNDMMDEATDVARKARKRADGYIA